MTTTAGSPPTGSGGAASRLGRRALGPQLFASAQDEPRSRRPTDVVLAIISALLVVIAGLAATLLPDFERSVSGVVSDVPAFFDTVWQLLFWVPVAWSLVILVVAVARGRLALARDLIAAIVLSVAGAAAAAAIANEIAIALAHRFVSFYLPPIWGYFCYGWLERRRYL